MTGSPGHSFQARAWRFEPGDRIGSFARAADPPPLWGLALRAVVVAWLGWVLVQSLRASRPHTIFAGIDLGIHEAGHLVFGCFGRFLEIAGGTILQLLAPIAAGIVFLRRGDRFAACFAAAWLGVNLVEVAVYVADARARVLPLVTIGGGDAIHDWNFLLGRMGLLRHDRAIAAILRGAGFLIHGAAVLTAAWIVVGAAMRRRTTPL